MWPRIVELALGVWLLASPALLPYPEGAGTWNALAAGALVVAFSILAWARLLAPARFGTLAVALWLAASAYFGAPYPAPAFLQSEFLTGILLGMFAIIPDDCNRPPRGWENLEPVKRSQNPRNG